MQLIGNSLRFSASDLAGHLNCRHLTALDAAAASGESDRPRAWDPLLQSLFERGLQHERQYVEHLKSSGLDVVEIGGKGVDQTSIDDTLSAMKAGSTIIVQGAFLFGQWAGRTDVLKRVEKPGTFGDWSYEVIDTKLARQTRGATVLQLCLYSDLLAQVQGCVPEHMYVVAPWSEFEPESFRTDAYAAYYRRARREFDRFLGSSGLRETYPEPNEHCETCLWRSPCDERRRADDHLCLVAGISKLQRTELERRGIRTTAALAGVPLPLAWKPDCGAPQSYERIREQARIQLEGRSAGRTIYETLPLAKDLGLASLPAPSPGDIFLDLEGDPFAGEGGMEYLFGYVFEAAEGPDVYCGDWALSRAQEKQIFERFVDFATARLERYADLHIYHYAPYEPAALKRLMGRYASREEEVDRLLRGRHFVDLYQVVRHGIRASVESYSIKQLEGLFGYSRVTGLMDAGQALAAVQGALEADDVAVVTEDLKATVTSYNRDDCLSARALRNWLEQIRAQVIAGGQSIERPSSAASEASEDVSVWQARIEQLVGRLTKGVPADVLERTGEEQARWLLAYVLDWHRREIKSVWWEYFRLSALPPDDLLDERAALSGLSFDQVVGGTAKAPIHRYRFPVQETELRGEEQLHQPGGEKLGAVASISLDERTIDIKKRQDTASIHPPAAFSHKVIGTKQQAEALVRIGDYVATNGLEGQGEYSAARDLILRRHPRLSGVAMRLPGETPLQSAVRIAPLFKGVLPIQGPPGTGKTFIGARMICALVSRGARVGITANSHKVIRRLLDEAIEAAQQSGMQLRCVQKSNDPQANHPHISFARNNDEVYANLLSGTCQVAAGTSWLWAPPGAHGSLDVIFVDEAAQMSLANVLAISQAAESMVLLGDPQQLEQPMRGSHPDGTDVSALYHLLSGHPTITDEQGLFLGETWRLHPDICGFTSEMFYENKLKPVAGVDRQVIRSNGRVAGTGLRYLPVAHEGNQNSSPEEAQAASDVVGHILESKTTWIDRMGVERPIALEDILIIAPYNAQVFELQERIPGGRIGTVDKFQGQEAPIVICSMTTSTYADAPRGMDFLYSSNRLNVATSRAQCLSILIASPAIFEPECRTPSQMRLANAFCRYLELARAI